MAEDKALRKVRSKLDKALEANRNDEAVKLLAELITCEPENARWPHKRGDLLRKLNRNEEAVECYAAAVDIYADQGFIARAVAMAKTVLNLDPARLDILERVDPMAAQQLRARQRPAGGAATGKHPMLLDDQAPTGGSTAERHPMLLDEPAPGGSIARRHPMLLDDAAGSGGSSAKHHPMVLDEPVPASGSSPKQHPMVFDDPPRTAAAPSPPKRAAPAVPPPPTPPTPNKGPRPAPPTVAAQPHTAANPPAPAPRRKPSVRAVTLDKLSLPPPLALRSAPARAEPQDEIADIYSQALHGVDELCIDPAAPANETRFSNAPPRPGREVSLSDAELAPRARVSELESLRPDPPAAARLADLPLFPLFAEVPKDTLAKMIAGSELIELEHGAFVMRKGDPGDAMYGIVEGSVDVVVPGQQFRLTLAEGDVFGESCLLLDEKCHADAIVEGKLVALRVPREVLIQVLQYHPPLAELLLELLTRRLLGNLLQTSPLFQEFDAAGRRELAGMFEIRRAPAGTMLAVVGKRMDGLYISLTGTLLVEQPGAPKRYAPPGSMFGQNTLLSNTLSQVDITTQANMVVLRLPAAKFTRMAMQYPTILARLTELATSEVIKVTV